ncbi:hypothetical protein G9A89_003125 [Geosiphon pyriformis]|nr:hypothetical protein G9A89_003125 [Geosiphon pyriformis]
MRQENEGNEQQPLIVNLPKDIPPSQGFIQAPIGYTFLNLQFVAYWVATAGSLFFTGTIWYVNLQGEYNHFIWHPILMSASVFLLTQGVLVLQQTSRPREKKRGLNFHLVLQYLSVITAFIGFLVAFYHRTINKKQHFKSTHSLLGLAALWLIFMQIMFGVAIVNITRLFGGLVEAKKMYKYHRMTGYLFLITAWLAMISGTQVGRTKREFQYEWVWLLLSCVTIFALVRRVVIRKMGFF